MIKMQKLTKSERGRIRSFFAYISPWLIGFTAFTVIPMVLSLIYSFTDVKMATANSQPLNWVGFANYIRIFTEDDNFRRAISLAISEDNMLAALFGRPITLVLLTLTILTIVFNVPSVKRFFQKKAA